MINTIGQQKCTHPTPTKDDAQTGLCTCNSNSISPRSQLHGTGFFHAQPVMPSVDCESQRPRMKHNSTAFFAKFRLEPSHLDGSDQNGNSSRSRFFQKCRPLKSSRLNSETYERKLSQERAHSLTESALLRGCSRRKRSKIRPKDEFSSLLPFSCRHIVYGSALLNA